MDNSFLFIIFTTNIHVMVRIKKVHSPWIFVSPGVYTVVFPFNRDQNNQVNSKEHL